MPALPVVAATDLTATPLPAATELHHLEVDVAVIGGGSSGRAAAADAERAGRTVRVLDAGAGEEVVAIYAGPMIVVRTPGGMLHVHPHEIVVATGAAEIHPVCPGNRLAGIVTARAAERLHDAGVDLGRVVAVGSPPAGTWATPVAGRLVRFEGDAEGPDGAPGRVRAVVTADPATGAETTTPADTVVVGLGLAPRDLLARMAGTVPVTVVGDAADDLPLPPPPTEGVVCGCMGTTVADLGAAWDRGFTELELLKRSSQACLGTVPGRRLPAQRPLVDRRPHRRHPRPVHRPSRRRARSPWPRPPPTPTSTPSGGPRSTTSISRPAPGWTGSVAGGGRGTTAMPSRNTGRSARASRSATSRRSASWSSPGRTSSSSSNGSTRATSRTSSPAARATRSCSTSAAT